MLNGEHFETVHALCGSSSYHLYYLQIMATYYQKHEPWEMGVHRRNGVIYLDVHKLPERPKSELERRRYKTFQISFNYEDCFLVFLRKCGEDSNVIILVQCVQGTIGLNPRRLVFFLFCLFQLG